MTEVVKPIVTPEEIAKKEKEKTERREKEKDSVRKMVDDAAKAHDELGKKFLKEDAEEAEKKAENKK